MQQFVFLEPIRKTMKKLLVPLMLISIGFAFYQQSLPNPNRIFTAVAFVVFVIAIMLFSSKLPSKNQPKEDEEDETRG